MTNQQTCARWGCDKEASYDKPLCYPHWQDWENWDLEECSNCHWFYSEDELLLYDLGNFDEEYPLLCDTCLALITAQSGELAARIQHKLEQVERRPVKAHPSLERPLRYVYILKLKDGSYYIGQTENLAIRFMEHRDGLQSQTKGKEVRLVFFERFEGERKEANARENELTRWNQSPEGRRRLRELIDAFRKPLRLLDLEA